MINEFTFLAIDALCTSIVILYFIEVLNRTRDISNKLVNLELNKLCFLIMMSNSFVYYIKLNNTRKVYLMLVLLPIISLASLQTLTGYISLLLVAPFVLLRIKYA